MRDKQTLMEALEMVNEFVSEEKSRLKESQASMSEKNKWRLTEAQRKIREFIKKTEE